jgi:NAD(P)-dependent dehydrogenase (short-subunit alcohol dehydrogenase family)
MSPLAVISGATKGLGFALASELVAHGWTVAGCGSSQSSVAAATERGGSIYSPRRTQDGSTSSLRVVDVAAAGAVAAWAADLPAADLVIANAGVVNAPAPIWELDPETFAQALAVNVGGVANLARAFLPGMIARGSGTFVAMSSGWGRRGKEGLSPYCASKFAVEGLVQSVALEVPAPIRVVSLDPGNGVRTAMLDTCLPEELDVPYPSPAEWAARAVGFILDTAVRAPSGSALKVPGIVVAARPAAAPDGARAVLVEARR